MPGLSGDNRPTRPWAGCSRRPKAGRYVLKGIHARIFRVGEGGVVGPVFLIAVGHFLHGWHGVTVIQLRSNHSHQLSIWKFKNKYKKLVL